MNDSRPLRVLIVEDDERSAAAMKKLLEKKFSAEVDVAGDAVSALERLDSGRYDILTLDYLLPDRNGIEMLPDVTAMPDSPAVIMITGHGDERTAAHAFQEGVVAYVVKDRKLADSLANAVESAREDIELKKAEMALEEERRFTDAALNVMYDVFFVTDFRGTILRWNRRVLELFDVTGEDLRGRRAYDFLDEKNAMRVEHGFERVLGDGFYKMEMHLVTGDGKQRPYEFSGDLIRDDEGNPIGVCIVGRDIAGRKRAEEALRKVIRETNERREEITALLESTRNILVSDSFEDAARKVFLQCKELLRARTGFVARLKNNDPGAELVYAEGILEEGSAPRATPMPVREIAREVFRSGKAEFENDLAASHVLRTIPEEHLRLENMLLIPLMALEEPAGLILLANKPGGFTNRDSLMGSAFGEIASLALRNSLTLEMLQDSEERFRSVAETATDAVVCADSDGRIIFWNEGAEKMFGYGSEELMGSPISIVVPERYRRAHLGAILRVGSPDQMESQGRTFELTGLRKDGSEFDIEISRSAWKVSGELFFTGIIRDITERKTSEEAIRESEWRYRTLVEAAPDVIYSITREGAFESLNPAFEKVTGWPREEWLGNSFKPLIHPDDVPAAVQTFERVLRGDAPPPDEFRIKSSSGEYLVGEFTSVPRKVTDEVVGVLGIARDVTARKKAQEELFRLNMELEGYAHAVSHDLKGPLSAIRAANITLSNILEKTGVKGIGEAIELSAIVEHNVQRSTGLIDGLLELAEVGQASEAFEDVVVSDLVGDILDEYSARIEERGAVVKADPDLGTVVCNPTHIYQLFANLIDNALKHNPGERPEIVIEYQGYDPVEGHGYLFRDNGPGIDEEIMGGIFQPFFSGGSEDTGIGLATVDKVVRVYDGEIRAYNDNGACFEFHLNNAGR